MNRLNRYAVALLLAMLISLASVTLRKSFAAAGGTNSQHSLVAIGGCPMPPEPPKK